MVRDLISIASEFIDGDSKRQVNIDGKLRLKIVAAVEALEEKEGSFGDCMDAVTRASDEVFEMMRTDSFTRFRKSKFYEDKDEGEFSTGVTPFMRSRRFEDKDEGEFSTGLTPFMRSQQLGFLPLSLQ